MTRSVKKPPTSPGFDAYSWLADAASAYNPFSPPDLNLDGNKEKLPSVNTRDRSRSRSAPRPTRSPPARFHRTTSFVGFQRDSGRKSKRRSSLNRPTLAFEVLGEEELDAMRAELDACGVLVEVKRRVAIFSAVYGGL